MRVLNCPRVDVLTGDEAIPVGAAATLKSYRVLEETYATYDEVESTFTDYNAIMYGHPGYPGGAPAPGSKGAGLLLGVEDDAGVEWWTTDVEGWDEGPDLDATTVQSSLMGTWVDRVRGKAREVTIKGTVIAPDIAALAVAKLQATSALSSPPHTGLMRISNVDLPVASTKSARLKLLGDLGFEFEMTMLGRNVGTPGLGVYREGVSRDYDIALGESVTVEYNSLIAGRPIIFLTGPFDAGLTISDGYGVITLAVPMAADDILLVDSVMWQVALNSVPARFMLTPQSRPLEFDHGGGTMTLTGTGTGKVSFTITELL